MHDMLTNQVRSGKDKVNNMPVQDTLQNLVEMKQATVTDRRITIKCEPILLTTLQSTALALVCNEAISNAIKHGSGNIEVKLEIVEEEVRLEVADDVPGFSDDFDPRRAAHTGLDLIATLVRHDLGGRIIFENRQKGGGQVRVVFPPSSDNHQPEEKP